MLMIVNATGLNKWYWLPKFQSDWGGKIWYFTIRWLGVETSVFSKVMGTELINQMDKLILHPER